MLPVALALGVSGCSTPSRRIARNPELFRTFPPEVQEKVRNGVIDLGFTKEMVRMAAGSPDRVYTRRTEGKMVETWAYVSLYMVPRRPWWTDRYLFFRDREGHPRYAVPDPHPMWDLEDYEYESLRVEFRDGRVSAIETADY